MLDQRRQRHRHRGAGLPAGEGLQLLALGGRLQECLELQATIDAWAKSEGCSVATATGRMGWLAVTKMPLGTAWRPRGVQVCQGVTDHGRWWWWPEHQHCPEQLAHSSRRG